jgi:hypothetical protein
MNEDRTITAQSPDHMTRYREIERRRNSSPRGRLRCSRRWRRRGGEVDPGNREVVVGVWVVELGSKLRFRTSTWSSTSSRRRWRGGATPAARTKPKSRVRRGSEDTSRWRGTGRVNPGRSLSDRRWRRMCPAAAGRAGGGGTSWAWGEGRVQVGNFQPERKWKR